MTLSWAKLTELAATATGTVLRHATITGPSVVGAALVSFGLGTAWSPLGWTAAGTFVLIADRKRALERQAVREPRRR